MNIIDQSMDIAISLLPKAKQNRNTRNKFFHFAFGYKKNKLIAIGQNNPEKTHTQALLLAKRFNINSEYPYLHAETDLISKLWGKYYIDDSLRMVIIRLNKRGRLRNSKPCERCDAIIGALGINKIWWSTDYGFDAQK
jgi:deoxycytidylate deaminase